MDFRTYIEQNYEELRTTTDNIAKGDIYVDDLFQFVVLKILEMEGIDDIPDKQKKFFFIKVLKTNWFSKTSRFEYEFRRKVTDRHVINRDVDVYNLETEDEEVYEELPDLEWVREQLQSFHWYKRDLFLMWLELQSVTKIANLTTIPMGTCGRHIREIKQEINELWEQRS